MKDTRSIRGLARFSLALVIGVIMTNADLQAEDALASVAPADLHVYVVAGDAALWGATGGLGAGAGVAIERIYVLNEDDAWEAARRPDGGTAASEALLFAQALLEQGPDIRIGLVPALAAGTMIEDWHVKSGHFRAARRRARVAMNRGTLKGVLWQHGRSVRMSALDHMKDLIAYLRSDYGALGLPFVMGALEDVPAMNAQLVQLVEDVHAVGVAKHDAGAGVRFASAMQELHEQAAERARRRAPLPDIPMIDAHIHGQSNRPDGLDIVVKWMDANNITHAITHDLRPTRAVNEEQRENLRANLAKHGDRILWFTFFEPEEVESVEEAVVMLEQMKAAGAVGFGEHYGRDRMFDDPANLRLYAACEQVGLPVMFHIDTNKNMVDRGMRQVKRVLEMFPDLVLIAHAEWWLYLPDGICDRMLQRYPNLYADVSGQAMTSMLNRERGYTEAFLVRNADKVLFGTDEGWWSFKDAVSENLSFQLFADLDLPEDVRYKIYRGNVERLFGLAGQER